MDDQYEKITVLLKKNKMENNVCKEVIVFDQGDLMIQDFLHDSAPPPPPRPQISSK